MAKQSSSASSSGRAAKAPAKKLFSFKKVAAASGTSGGSGGSNWKAGRRRAFKTSKAMFSLIAAKYQKGDKLGAYTGAVYLRAKPRYGGNDTF